jgi:hypothetical protein
MTADASTAGEARGVFRAALEAGDLASAKRAARTLLGNNPQGGAASFISRAIQKAPPDRVPLTPLRVALLSSFSIEFIHDVPWRSGSWKGCASDLQAGFGQFRQEILNQDSGFWPSRPTAVLALVGIFPGLYGTIARRRCQLRVLWRGAGGGDGAGVPRAVFRSSRPQPRHDLAPPRYFDGHSAPVRPSWWPRSNDTLSRLPGTAGCHAVDYAGLVHRRRVSGTMPWRSMRGRRSRRPPPLLALEYVVLPGADGKTRKCLVSI